MRKDGFYYRSIDGESICCPECGFIIEDIPGDWLDARVGDSIPCPNCALSSRIPTAEEGLWPTKKDFGDSTRNVDRTVLESERLSPA